jgi:hypothetical protein
MVKGIVFAQGQRTSSEQLGLNNKETSGKLCARVFEQHEPANNKKEKARTMTDPPIKRSFKDDFGVEIMFYEWPVAEPKAVIQIAHDSSNSRTNKSRDLETWVLVE